MDAKEGCLALLARNITVHLQNGDPKSDIYTVPVGKEMIVVGVSIRNPTVSLAGGTDFDLGDGANADTWKTAVDLSSLVNVDTDYIYITNDNTRITIFNAGDVFGIKPVTGAVGNADAKADLIGYLFDA